MWATWTKRPKMASKTGRALPSSELLAPDRSYVFFVSKKYKMESVSQLYKYPVVLSDMKLVFLKIFFFLSIFCSGCLNTETDENPLGLDLASGSLAINEPFCQRLGRVDPVQVEKSELPLLHQDLRDFCSHLIDLRPEELHMPTKRFLQCDLKLQTWDEETWSQWDLFAANIQQPGLLQENIINEGDIYRSDRGLSLLISIFTDTAVGFGSQAAKTTGHSLQPAANSEVQYFWNQEDLWPFLSSPLPDFESLSWRLNIQEPVGDICKRSTKWENIDDQFFLNSQPSCQGSQGLHTNYVFDSVGRLLRHSSESTDLVSCSP